MFIEGLSTRHTRVGTFRFGVVYEIDEKAQQIKKNVLPLLKGENPALKELSKAEVSKRRKEALKVSTDKVVPDGNATAADLRGQLNKALEDARGAQERVVQANDDALAAERRAIKAEEAEKESRAKLEAVQVELEAAVKRAEKAEAKI